MKEVFLPPPPGYRFNPTDEELITYYLWPKAAKQPLPPSSIVEKPLYGINANPWEVFSDDDPWETYTTFDKNGTKTLKETIYVFTTLSKINNGKKRVSRIAGCGLWDGQTGATSIHDCQGNYVIGSKKMLSFETKKGSDGSEMKKIHGHWIMHEYSLDGTSNEVLCKITRTWKGKDINLAPVVGENRKRSLKDANPNLNGGDHGNKKAKFTMVPVVSTNDIQESTANCEASDNIETDDSRFSESLEAMLMEEDAQDYECARFSESLEALETILMEDAQDQDYENDARFCESLEGLETILMENAQHQDYDYARFCASLEELETIPDLDIASSDPLAPWSAVNDTPEKWGSFCSPIFQLDSSKSSLIYN